MSKKNKKNKMEKTRVEQILGKNNVAYKQAEFPTHQNGDVRSMSIDHTGVDEHIIYKTPALTGNVAGSLVGVVPVDTHLDEKKLVKVSGNKKVNMVLLKNLLEATGCVHDANAPMGICEKFEYPIFINNEAREQGDIFASSGKVGRPIKLNAEDLTTLVHAISAGLEQK